MNTSPPANGPLNRRATARRQPAADTVCRLDPAAGVGLVWNISAGGISMLLRERLDRGATVRGALETANANALPVSLRVAHVAQLRTGDYMVGAEFDRALTADEMRPFLSQVAGA